MVQVNSLQKRIIAGTLVISLLAGLVIHNIRKQEIKPKAFSSSYGVCIDQHRVSSDGMWHSGDKYVEVTKDTTGMMVGSDDYNYWMEKNKQAVKTYIEKNGALPAGTANLTFWAGVATFITEGKSFGGTDLANAVAWRDYAIKAYDTSSTYGYADTGLTPVFPAMTEYQLGQIRYVNHDYLMGDENKFFRLVAGIQGADQSELDDQTFFSKDIDYRPQVAPRLSKAWLNSYQAHQDGKSGMKTWPKNTWDYHYIQVTDDQINNVTLDMVKNAAYDITNDDDYKNIVEVEAIGIDAAGSSDDTSDDSPSVGPGMIVYAAENDKDNESGTPGNHEYSYSTETETETSTIQKEYFINCNQAFFYNADYFMVWDEGTSSWVRCPMTRNDSQWGEWVNGWLVERVHQHDPERWYIHLTWAGPNGDGSGEPNPLYGYFEIPKGSVASMNQEVYEDPLEFVARYMRVYVCTYCPHKSSAGHQVHIAFRGVPATPNLYPCIKIGGSKKIPGTYEGEGSIHFCIFNHKEDWTSDYRLKMRKFDYETGQPLEGARFDLYERFDDKDELDTEQDGAVALYDYSETGQKEEYHGGYSDALVQWDDFRLVNSYKTEEDGTINATVPKHYHYDKTFCDGHPAPTFVEVPELKEAEEGEGGDEGDSGEGEGEAEDNSEEVEAAKEINRQLAKQWLEYYNTCIDKADELDGVHFHWVSDEVDIGEIETIAETGGEEGTTPDAGPTECFGIETSYDESGCHQDAQDTYEKFIALKYSYTWKEVEARNGYILHDLHTDDVPIEVITTDSSQNGANSSFANTYSKDITINENVREYLNDQFIDNNDNDDDNDDDNWDDDDDYDDDDSPGSIINNQKTLLDYMIKFVGNIFHIENVYAGELDTNESLLNKAWNVFNGYVQNVESFFVENADTQEDEEEDIKDENEEDDEEEFEDEAKSSEDEEEISTSSIVTRKKINTSSNIETEADISFLNEMKISTKKAANFTANLLGLSDDEDYDDESGTEGLGTAGDFEEIYDRARSDANQSEGATNISDYNSETEITADDDEVNRPNEDLSHCNDKDGEGNHWRIYDHRTPGEIHFNKRDLDLSDNTSDKFDDYAQTNGDGSLSGAVYGLFARNDITHPDGKTGVVYKQNDLVAIATTDRDGNGSFMSYTEAPGTRYDYSKGTIVTTDWYNQAPKNLYGSLLNSQSNVKITSGAFTETESYVDDYTEDDNYKNGAPTQRLYDNNESNNGNEWIGRPLIMGDYYIKELSRSEGYELSVNGKGKYITNDKTDFEPQFANYSGSVSVNEKLYIHPQESYGLSNDLLYEITSEKTNETNGYDVVLRNLPSDAKIYRQDISKLPSTVQVIDHYDYVDKKDENGNIIYQVAQTDDSIPKLKTDGSGDYETEEAVVKAVASKTPFATHRKYDSRTINDMITNPADPDGSDLPNLMAATYTMNDEQTSLLKYKLEEILRTQGVKTPVVTENGVKRYSEINAPVYMRGVREGDTDTFNISGVGAGNTATETVYGPQIINIKLKKINVDGNASTVADLIGSLMNYYQENPYWNVGGLDHVESNDIYYDFYIYASNSSNTTFVSDKNDPVVYVPIKFNPDDTTKKPQYIYAKYVSENADSTDKSNAFGLYTNYTVNTNNTATVTLSPKVAVNNDGILTGDGTMTAAKMIQTVKYRKGETIHDKNGNPVAEKEAVPVYKETTITANETQWIPLNVTPNEKGEFIYHVTMPFTNVFNETINDDNQYTVKFKAVVPEGEHTLTAEDVKNAPKSYNAQVGQTVDNGEYYLYYKGANVQAYLNYKTLDDGGETFVKTVTLAYRNQEDTYQDGNANMPGQGTIQNPVQVYERPIRQKVRVIKDITTIQTKQVWYCNNCGTENTDSDTQCKKCHETRTTETTKTVKYDNDTYTAVHEDNLSASNDGTKTKDWGLQLLKDNISEEKADNIPDFMFKAYLKSNLERLYRDENGNIIWLDRNGNRKTPQYQDTNNDGNYDTFTWKYDTAFNNKTVEFPVRDYVHDNVLESANVQKIFTNIPHNTGSKTNSTIANNVLSKYQDPNTGHMENAGERNAFSTILRSKNDTVADPSDITGLGIYSNASLFSYKGWLDLPNKTHKAINADQNKNYTRILETTEETIPDGSTNGTAVINSYNYEKFFDAINVANVDKWDNDMYSTFTGNSMDNNPGQHWFDTFYEKYQKDDRDKDHTLENTDNSDKDNTTGGDKDTSFKPFRWIRENVFGNRADYEKYPAQTNGANTEVVTSTSDYARANAAASDAVRQFAIKWYLEDEIAKLEKDSKNYELIANKNNSTISYDEAIYDEGLYNAIAKTYNYMKPFYTYDLDTIYSVEWDSAENGGKDQDYTTLAVNMQDESSYYAISAYLPYGTYVIVEQQPNRIDSNVNEWKNKHYEIDKPKEIAIPTLYNSEQSNKEGVTNYDSHYNFDASVTLETLAKSSNYLIRFGDEWKNTGLKQNKYVIRAHNYFGDYELYPYGLTIDKVNSSERNYDGIDSDSGKFNYAGWRYVQEEYDPIKNVYNTQHRGENGANQTTKEEGANDGAGYYGTDITDGKPTANGDYYNGDRIKNDLFYGNISENKGVSEKEVYNLAGYVKNNNTTGKYIKKNVRTVTGEQTAYDGKYSSILVPWSITTPVNINNYNSKDFTGYADVRFTNKFKATVLRINKTDSETGEYILHDNAIFGLYAASRYNTFDEIKKDSQLINDSAEREQFLEQFKPGDAKFYLVDTTIYGSREFLEAMKAVDITLIDDPQTIEAYSSKRGELFSGKVKKGTPICVEEERIMLTDSFGNRTGQDTVYTTLNEVYATKEDNKNEKSYILQNTGYFETPQPIGAGVYVLAEIKAPDGYAKTNPVAIEIYSDSSKYYVDGDMYAKADMLKYDFNSVIDFDYIHKDKTKNP